MTRALIILAMLSIQDGIDDYHKTHKLTDWGKFAAEYTAPPIIVHKKRSTDTTSLEYWDFITEKFYPLSKVEVTTISETYVRYSTTHRVLRSLPDPNDVEPMPAPVDPNAVKALVLEKMKEFPELQGALELLE